MTISPALSIEHVTVRFGGLVAVSDLSFSVNEGELVSLIGPNGAGKTTAFNVVTGFLAPTQGEVRYRGTSLNGLKSHEVANLGLVRTFQKTSVFGNNTVFDNVLIGLHRHGRSSVWGTLLALPSVRKEEQQLREQVREILDFVGLDRRAGELGSALPYGEQRLLEVAVALAARPTLLLLDEPVSGMNASETASFIELLGRIRNRDVTVLLVEHDMHLVMNVSDRIVVLNYGKIIAEGPPAAIQQNPEVIRAYLGQGVNVLELTDLVCCYGKVEALKRVSLVVNKGELVTLIGANGAGKTTTLKAISGLLPLTSGRMIFEGEDITRASPRRILSRGIAHCPEGRHIFPDMTVQENLEMGCYLRSDSDKVASDMARIFESFPVLAERRRQTAGTLSGGEQQMLAIGRALMSRPKLILFDEPSLGLAPNIVERTFEIIQRIRAEGTTVLMVEQNAYAALDMCDRAYLLESGTLTLEGTGRELIDNPHIRKAYLGG